MRIGDREIGGEFPPYVIAEIGVNHDGSAERALELTDAAADAGADAVKLQLFRTDLLLSRAAKLAAYQAAAGETDPVEMLRRLELSVDEMEPVAERAHARGIHAIVTVFSVELVAEAERLRWDAYKSASPDIINRPLLGAMAATGKPVIVSTGASTMEEVVRAVGWLEPARERLAMLQCVSCYPAPVEALGGIRAIADATGLPTGLSDHHGGSHRGGWRAAAAGAVILEKHITYDSSAVGPDHAASASPESFRRYVEQAREGARLRGAGAWCQHMYAQLGEERVRAEVAERFGLEGAVAGELVKWVGSRSPLKEVLDCERDVREVSRQSVTTKRAMEAGHALGPEDLTIKRPGTGIEPWRLDQVVGRRLAREVEADVPLREDDLLVR